MRKSKLVTSSSALILSAFILANGQAIQAEELANATPAITETNPTPVAQTDTSKPAESPATANSTQTPTQEVAPQVGGTAPTVQPATAVNSQAPATSPTQNSQASPATASPVPAQNQATSQATSPSEPTVILHTNDMHGRMEQANGVIGLAKLTTVVEEERAKPNQTTLVLDAGDAFQGLPISNASQGEEMAKAMNAIGYDAMAVGNHEFDFGLDQAKRYKEVLNFPLLSANTYVNGARLFDASVLIDKNKAVTGDEVVVIGVTTPETATKTHPNNVAGVTFADPITEVKKVIEQTEATARATGVSYDKYIILAHLGIDASTPTEWRGDNLAQALADYAPLAGKKVIVIDGHSHSVHSANFGHVTYSQTGSYLNNIGKISLTSDGSVTPGLIAAADTAAISPNSNIAAIVSAAKAKFEAENATLVLANNPVEFNGDRENVRVRETNSGNAITDALYDYGQTGFSQPTDLAVTNGGGIRASIKANQPVTRGDIISVLPFGNIISQIEVTGNQIRAMFEQSLSAANQTDANGAPLLDERGLPLLAPSGGFLHASGVRVYFDPTAPVGSRLVGIQILDRGTGNYQNLDPNRTYRLATNDFLAAGGDGYTMLGGAREEGPSMDTVFANYLASLVDPSIYSAINSYNRIIPVATDADDDGDGFTNVNEIINQADPFDPASVPVLSQVSSNPPTVQLPSLTLPDDGSDSPLPSRTNLRPVRKTSVQANTSTRKTSLDKAGSSQLTSENDANRSLPQTGQTNELASLYGLGLLSMASLLALAKKMRQED